MYNVNPETGVRYGVISVNALNPAIVEDLFYGSDAVDLSYREAYEEAKAVAESRYATLLEDAETAASETDHLMNDNDREAFIENWFEDQNLEADPEMFVERELEQFSDICQIDEPVIEGEYEGVKYHLSCLGGAYNLWVFEGPLGTVNQLCSPCCPGAADLDSGFALDTEFEEGYEPDTGYSCYCIPRSWLYDEPTKGTK